MVAARRISMLKIDHIVSYCENEIKISCNRCLTMMERFYINNIM
jgi:hypothetical protein